MSKRKGYYMCNEVNSELRKLAAQYEHYGYDPEIAMIMARSKMEADLGEPLSDDVEQCKND